MLYSALIIDILESRKYKDRFKIQMIIKESINYLNKQFKSMMAKERMFSGGDENQGLFLNSESAFLYFRKLQLMIFPIKIRGGIGRGGIISMKIGFQPNWTEMLIIKLGNNNKHSRKKILIQFFIIQGILQINLSICFRWQIGKSKGDNQIRQKPLS